MILPRIVRDAVGGRAEDVVRFADRELFGPLGMRRVTLESDAADTPVGSSCRYATARDWTRFGLLYAHDGVVGGARVLPEGWVDFSATWTPGSRDGYGAGFFTNRGASEGARFRVQGGMPPDSFFASGTQGQRLVIAPAARLVVARPGSTPDRDAFDKRAMLRLAAGATAARGCRFSGRARGDRAPHGAARERSARPSGRPPGPTARAGRRPSRPPRGRPAGSCTRRRSQRAARA